MTTRLKGFVVALKEDMREDDAQSTIDAIRHIKGVISVEPVETDDLLTDSIIHSRVKREMTEGIWKAIYGEEWPNS